MKKTNALRILERKKIAYQLKSYTYDPENLDVKKIAQENDLKIEEVYKTLVLKGNKTGLLVAVIPGHKVLNRKALANASGNKKINLLTIDQLEPLTGYIRGGCSPIGMKSSPPIFIDIAAKIQEEIWINAGIRGQLVKLHINDLIAVSSGQLSPIAE